MISSLILAFLFLQSGGMRYKGTGYSGAYGTLGSTTTTVTYTGKPVMQSGMQPQTGYGMPQTMAGQYPPSQQYPPQQGYPQQGMTSTTMTMNGHQYPPQYPLQQGMQPGMNPPSYPPQQGMQQPGMYNPQTSQYPPQSGMQPQQQGMQYPQQGMYTPQTGQYPPQQQGQQGMQYPPQYPPSQQ